MEFIAQKWYYIVIAMVAFMCFIFFRDFRDTLFPLIKDSFTQSNVLKTGVAVNADIVYAHQTTMWDGGRPVYRLTLKFKTREGQETESSTLKTLSFEEIERFKAGNGTTIKYDPKNPQRIAIYDRPLILGDL